MHLATYVQLLEHGSTVLARSYQVLADGHADEAEVVTQARRFAVQCQDHASRLLPARKRYGDHPEPPDRLHRTGLQHPRTGGLGLLRDLHEVSDHVSHLHLAWTIVGQAAQGNRDTDLHDTATACTAQIATQLAWLTTQIKTASPQALLVAR